MDQIVVYTYTNIIYSLGINKFTIVVMLEKVKI